MLHADPERPLPSHRQSPDRPRTLANMKHPLDLRRDVIDQQIFVALKPITRMQRQIHIPRRSAVWKNNDQRQIGQTNDLD